MTRKKPHKFVETKKCEKVLIIDGEKFGCSEKAQGLIDQEYLCKYHYREIKPLKKYFRHKQLTKGLVGDKFKETLTYVE